MSSISISMGVTQNCHCYAPVQPVPMVLRISPDGPAFVQTLPNGDVSVTPNSDPWGNAPYILTPAQITGLETSPFGLQPGSIAGTTGLGDTLSYQPALWAYDADGAAATTTWQWYADGVAISDAIATTFVITAAEQGTDITVTETCQQTGYTTVTQGSNALTIPPGTLPAQSDPSAPVLSGTPVLGTTITLAPGTSAGANQHEYRWLLNDTILPGATATTYTATTEGALRCEQRSKQNGVTEWSAWVSSAVLTITYAAPVLNSPIADISVIENTTDQVIDLKPLFSNDTGGSWSVSGTGTSVTADGIMTVTFASLRTDSPVSYGYTNSGGTANGSFNVTVNTYPAPVAAGALADQSFTVGSGDQTVDASGDFTNAVGGSWSVTGAGATINGSGLVSLPTTSALPATPVTVSYTNSGGTANSAFSVVVSVPLGIETNAGGTIDITTEANGDLTITPTPDPWGNAPYTMTPAQVSGTQTSPHNLSPGQITGTTGLGDTLTYLPAFWANDADGPDLVTSSQWYADGTAISGATGLTFDITAAEQGKAITVVESAAQTGYTTASQTSNAVAVPGGATIIQDFSGNTAFILSASDGGHAGDTRTISVNENSVGVVSWAVNLTNGSQYRFTGSSTISNGDTFGGDNARLASDAVLLSNVIIQPNMAGPFDETFTHTGATGAYYIGFRAYFGGAGTGPRSVQLVNWKLEQI